MVALNTQTLFPVDEFVREEVYPGYTPSFGTQPFVADPLRPFSKADNDRFWMHDSMHFGAGMVPASIALLEDAQTWGTQLAAEIVGVPPTRGMVNRLAGTHVYIGQLDVASEWQLGARAARFENYVKPLLENFDQYWARCEAELRAGYGHFENLDLGTMTPDELWSSLKDAYEFHRRGWYLHFEVMYALAANYVSFHQLAQQLGLDPKQVARYLAGKPTKYLETDEQMWRLAGRARELDVVDALTDPQHTRARLQATAAGATWWEEFEQFLGVYGWRTEETCTINTPPWIENPTPPLHTIREFLNKPEGHEFAATQQAVIDERDQLVEDARRSISNPSDRRAFDDALAANRAANFVWWNDEHNYLIDRRIAIPVRRASLQLARHLVDAGRLEQPEDIFFVFKAELFDAMERDSSAWARLASLVPHRRDYFEEWRHRGPTLPPMLGTVPDEVGDPLMVEIFGLTPDYLQTIKRGGSAEELTGFPASPGSVEGVARMVDSALELDQVQAGEVLVCGGTTTEWTPVFGLVEACVCDTGGSLAHAAIVAREYGIPCVVGTATASSSIATGDRVRVDGDRGTVRILR